MVAVAHTIEQLSDQVTRDAVVLLLAITSLFMLAIIILIAWRR